MMEYKSITHPSKAELSRQQVNVLINRLPLLDVRNVVLIKGGKIFPIGYSV